MNKKRAVGMMLARTGESGIVAITQASTRTHV